MTNGRKYSATALKFDTLKRAIKIYVMRIDLHMMKRVLLFALLVLPIAVWVFFKPVRVIAPEWAGVSCVTEDICVDDPARLAQASRLYRNAIQFVDASIGETRHKPRVIFCATETCFQSFGLGKRSAATIGTFGIVVSPRAWEPYYVLHEMIHHLQKERLGILKTWVSTPEWFIEGMAYSLSEDPRTVLAEPLQQYRTDFEVWYRQVGKQRLWAEAENL
jgi:hypothetical protein